MGEWSGVVGLVEVGHGLSEEISASDGVVGPSFWVSWSICSMTDLTSPMMSPSWVFRINVDVVCA